MRRAVGKACLVVAVALCGAVGGASWVRSADEAKPTLENLLRTELEGVDGTEVIVSVVDMPPGFTFPYHTHPGEEFVYVLEGSARALLKGEPEVIVSAGQVFKVPLERVHSATAGAEGCKVLVFRVHRTGQPERTLVE